MKIKSKEQIIEHFTSGNKNNQFIGVENEKFLFKKQNNIRAEYSDLLKVFNIFIQKFNWQAIKEDENTIGLKKMEKQLLLNQEIKLNYQAVNYLIFMRYVQSHTSFKKN